MEEREGKGRGNRKGKKDESGFLRGRGEREKGEGEIG